MVKLNIGSGTDIKQGWINIDRVKSIGVDIILDLNKKCLPFKDSSVDEIFCSHVLEHLINPHEVVMEFWRVLKPDGILTIKLPTHACGLHHLRYNHNENYLNCLCTDDSKTSLQTKKLFDKVYVKGRIRRFKTILWHLRDYILSWTVDEYEYKLKKHS